MLYIRGNNQQLPYCRILLISPAPVAPVFDLLLIKRHLWHYCNFFFHSFASGSVISASDRELLSVAELIVTWAR